MKISFAANGYYGSESQDMQHLFPKYVPLSSVFFFGLFLVCSSVYANTLTARNQNRQDFHIPEVRAAYVQELTRKRRAAKAEAEAWARARGIPVRYDDGWNVSELMYLENERPVYIMTHNVDAAISTATNLVRNTVPYLVDGNGLTVGVWDAGAVLSTHQEFGLRVSVMDVPDAHNHATHVAGTIGALGIDAAALGMAPNVNIDSYDWDFDFSEMAARGASYPNEPGTIYVSNHSYGSVTGWALGDWSGSNGWHWYGDWSGASSVEEDFGQYDREARDNDEVAYNAPYYLIFQGAGNDRNDNPSGGETVYYYQGGTWHSITYSTSTCPPGDGIVKNGYDTILQRGVAKNIMTVGAVADAVSGSARNVNNAAMSSFSSWGPADDGRIKPDIVANGIGLYSPIASSDTSYDSKNGTSMSTPNASGSAILLAEHYFNLFPGKAMRSSTLKGLIIHTADDLGNSGPDYSYGWGLMNTEAAAALITDQNDHSEGSYIFEEVLDSNTPSRGYGFSSDGSRSILVTLCWTDPPSGPISQHDDPSPCLWNDLDLRVIRNSEPSTTYYPYVLDPYNPSVVATTGDNTLDNVEQVFVPTSGIEDFYTVTVSHKGSLIDGEQHYSLIFSFVPPPPIVTVTQPAQGDLQCVVKQIEVVFNKTVINVSFDDLELSNGIVISVSGNGEGPYIFELSQTEPGAIVATLDGDIEDTDGVDLTAYQWTFTQTTVDGDIDCDGNVDFNDFALLTLNWDGYGCQEPNWCDGSDINHSTAVDSIDLDIFARNWLTKSLVHGLIGYWAFDEGSGVVAHDYSDNGIDGTIQGAGWDQDAMVETGGIDVGRENWFFPSDGRATSKVKM